MKNSIVALSLLTLVGCAHAPVVSNPGEKPGVAATGSVEPLQALLVNKTRAVVVFVHGVGDHCPGFALDEHDGYLSKAHWVDLGLTPTTATSWSPPIPVQSFVPGHPPDSASYVMYGTREFSFQRSKNEVMPLTVVEITWSPLTQWIKSNQLNYDLTREVDLPNDPKGDCPYKNGTAYKKPPSRAAINRLLKETVLNRDLADAVLYAGSYGRVMRRGIAQALCLALGGTRQEAGNLCHWPLVPSQPERSNTSYFFVTHSLGSRMVYDTLLGLNEEDVLPDANTFTRDEVTQSKPFIQYLTAATGSMYMMANQLPMLGLAFEDIGHTSGTSTGELEVTPESLHRDSALATEPQGSVAPPDLVKFANAQISVAPVRLAEVRSGAFQKWEMPMRSLNVVAFSDTNDLLSWGVPEWYQQKAKDHGAAVDFTNVYVQNAFHWFGIAEDPGAAHSNYFSSGAVWQIIRCGAKDGRVLRCK